MIRFASIVVAFGLAAAGSSAFAGKSEPVLMTDAEMDKVTAGELLTIVFQDSFNNFTVNLNGGGGGGNGHSSDSAPTFVFQINIAANVNAAIAGGDATAIQTVGTQTVGTLALMARVPTQTLRATRR
jgi:hypothetical protein